MTYVAKCPNCKRANEPICIFEGSKAKLNAEYKCVCDCHWINRFGFFRRDILNMGDKKQRVGEHLD